MQEEYKDLIRFLCAVWYEIDELRYKAYAMEPEEMKEFLINSWPLAQGTSNQLNLMKIGGQKYNRENIKKAVDYMLTCQTCGGSGKVHSHNPKCWDCDGTGKA